MEDQRKLRLASLVLAGLAREARAQAGCSRQLLYQYVEQLRRSLGAKTVATIQHQARSQAAQAIYRELRRLHSRNVPSQRRKKTGAHTDDPARTEETEEAAS